MDSVVLTFEVIIGILCCLFGFKFQKVVISLIGCVLGFRLGSWIVNYFAITGGLEIVLKFGLLLVVGACSLSLFESLISIVTGLSIFSLDFPSNLLLVFCCKVDFFILFPLF